jgi:serine O-acetyltransferase
VLDNLRADARRLAEKGTRGLVFYVVEALLFDAGFQAVVLYRLASWLKRSHVPVLPALVTRWSVHSTGVEISPIAVIGPGLRIPHGVGIVVGGYARVGGGAMILQQVTLGSPSQGRLTEMPRLGDRVFLGAGCRLIGAIEVGDDVVVGPNAVVTQSIPAGSRVTAAAGIEVVERAAKPVSPGR